MAEILWRTEYENGRRKLICDLAEIGFYIDDDGQQSGLFLAVAGPLGAEASLGPVLAKGDRGFSPSIQIGAFDELDADDPTPAFLSLDLLVEGTDVSAPVYALNGAFHRGIQGEAGVATWDPSDVDPDPQLGYVPAVAAGLGSFELVPLKVSRQYWPATVSNVPGGTSATFEMTVIPVAAEPYDRYVIPSGTVQVTAASGTNLRVDLVAHLDSASGPIVGRDYGRAGASDKLTLVGFPDAGASSSATRISAGQGANIHFLTEKQSGSSAYSSVPGTARFGVLTVPA